jgi:carboxypeptidase C (cathepsin A)
MDLFSLRTAYEISKALRRDPKTFKSYTDRDFARDYLDSNFSMVTKVLTGKAVSKPTTDAIIKFIRDTYPCLKAAMNKIDNLVKLDLS